MFGLSLIKTSSLNNMRANITSFELQKVELQSKVSNCQSIIKEWRVKAESLQHKIEELNKELVRQTTPKDPKSGKFVKRTENIQG